MRKTVSNSRACLRAVDIALRRVYGVPTERRRDPIAVLVATVLSQNTNGVNSSRAYRAMREAFPKWEDVIEASLGKLEKVLRPGGLARTKSKRIQKMLRSIAARGSFSLRHLEKMSVEEAEGELRSFDGVGPKTARCVLLFAFAKDAFPVDTHIERILKRLGLVPPGMSAEKIHESVQPLVPKGRFLSLHLNLIAHGRAVCHPRNPECTYCVVKARCAYGRQKTESDRKRSLHARD